MSLIASAKFQAWLRAENDRRCSVFVSINAIRPQRKARTRDAIGEIRHVFPDAGVARRCWRRLPRIVTSLAQLRDPHFAHRLHVLWRLTGFTKESVEGNAEAMAGELGTDRAATSCAQVTRLPGFFNHKYRPGPVVTVEYGTGRRPWKLHDPRQYVEHESADADAEMGLIRIGGELR